MNITQASFYLPVGPGAPGFLSVPTPGGPVTFRLSARQSTLILQLVLTHQRQSTWPPECRGWMTAQLIGELMGAGEKDYVVSAESVRKYVGRIRKKIREQLGEAYAKFDPFEQTAQLGYRLSIGIELFGPEPLAA
jgi:hypothetical protein